MESHEECLRAEVGEKARAAQEDYRSAGLSAREIALLDFAMKLTQAPSSVGREGLDALRAHGFSDEQLVDAVHCVSYFNFINRVLDGLGVDPDPFMRYSQQEQ